VISVLALRSICPCSSSTAKLNFFLCSIFDNVLEIRVKVRVTFRVSFRVRVEVMARIRVALFLGIFHGK